MNKIYLSSADKKFGGVIGGVGEALDVDPTILRLLFVFVMLITAIAPAIFTYIVAWLIIPKSPITRVVSN